MESLDCIKSDLVKTADHLEALGKALNGHARFIQARGAHPDQIDVDAHIQALAQVTEALREVATKMQSSLCPTVPNK
ncbi:hypothetical protein IRZ81_21065 [Pseudomonas putida]|uniref:Uncharacterized protein n=1 Tax=Pseudomonas parafulva TaxID=157782 RepID=A0AAJ0PFI1_9PSED|nr:MULTISPECIES: hypothetical protein [Pseudomonas]AQW68601.1 hypothetical protein B2J77_10455 [Pseudomonas parafulva]KTT18165.1 hypothetical protein NS96R_08680 [Pseudomonas parafulva]MBF8636867.1 hypothetical protein [Pseudomonas fulva]MBF8653267.1 hypothetical protein [Pseudomonas putida]MBF8657565.1 hypothetical protein [Pseudomonas putida]